MGAARPVLTTNSAARAGFASAAIRATIETRVVTHAGGVSATWTRERGVRRPRQQGATARRSSERTELTTRLAAGARSTMQTTALAPSRAPTSTFSPPDRNRRHGVRLAPLTLRAGRQRTDAPVHPAEVSAIATATEPAAIRGVPSTRWRADWKPVSRAESS
jgi:hypothetical protein